MQIIKITFKNNLYEITLSNQEKHKFYEDVLLKFNIIKPCSITNKTFELMQHENDYYLALNKAIKYLKVLKPTYVVKKYLEKMELSEEYITEILKFLEKNGLLDDSYYATSLIQSLEKKGYGKYYIEEKLKSYGLHKYIPKEFDANCEKCFQKYLQTHTKLSKEEVKQKAYAYLLRHGFTYEEINNVLRSFENGKR